MIRKEWLAIVLQTVGLLGGGILYAITQEHRFTVLEETLRSQASIIARQEQTQQLIITQIGQVQQTQARMIALEDFIHGISPDEEASRTRRLNRR